MPLALRVQSKGVRCLGSQRRPRTRSGAAPRRCSGRPEPGRRAPLFEAGSFDEDTGVAAFDPCAWPPRRVRTGRRCARPSFERSPEERSALPLAPCPLTGRPLPS